MEFTQLQTLFQQIMTRSEGAKFYRVDLHNHTPADKGFHCNGWAVDTTEQKQAFAQEYVRFARQVQKLDILGITDHNSVEWVKHIQTAVKGVDGLYVFPGFEIGAMSGKRQVHFIVLFDPGTDAENINHYLSSLGLTPEQRFHQNGDPCLVKKSVDELLETIKANSSLRGLPIAAHVCGKNGLLKDLDGEQRILAYTHPGLIAVEIPGALTELSDCEQTILSGQAELYNHKAVACLNHSDGRGLQQVHPGKLSVGAKATRIKLSRVNIDALRQAFIDFDSRIRLENAYYERPIPKLLGISIEGGFLVERGTDETSTPLLLHFNPNLNTLIGGRGAGKSALVEAIRYVFDLPAQTPDTEDQIERILGYTLKAGTRINAYYQLPGGERYAISRVKGQTSDVYDLETGECCGVHPKSILPGGLPVEIYGQREIFEISKDPNFQLKLLNGYVADELNEIRHQESELLTALKTNAQSLLNLQEEIAQAGQRLQELPGIRLELERLERQEAVSRLEEKKLVEREATLLARAAQEVSDLLTALGNFQNQQSSLDTIIPEIAQLQHEKLPHTDFLLSQKILLARIDQILIDVFINLSAAISQTWQEGQVERDEWQSGYQKVQDSYQELLRTLGADLTAERYFQLQSRLELLQSIEQELQLRQGRVDELKTERRALIRHLRILRRRVEFPILQGKCNQLTTALKGNVRITLCRQGNRQEYAKKMVDLFAGNRIERSVIEQIAQARLPRWEGQPGPYADNIHLAAAIRLEQQSPSDNASVLNMVYHVSKAYRERLARLDESVLWDLETYRIPDLPDIALRVGSQYRSINPPLGQAGLSTGQKCTAILSMILVERDVPLVIDQPEDDLDNEFIYREIVQTLRREKERRQFIIATHNANIPVSGDAELILLLKADENHGWIERSGSIDDPEMREPVENVLEGGKEAFQLRQSKYEKWE